MSERLNEGSLGRRPLNCCGFVPFTQIESTPNVVAANGWTFAWRAASDCWPATPIEFLRLLVSLIFRISAARATGNIPVARLK
jgi:hypothetical protein